MLSAPDTLQNMGHLRTHCKGTDDGFPSLSLWTLNLVLGLSLASIAHWFFADIPSTISGRGSGGRGVSEVTDPHEDVRFLLVY